MCWSERGRGLARSARASRGGGRAGSTTVTDRGAARRWRVGPARKRRSRRPIGVACDVLLRKGAERRIGGGSGGGRDVCGREGAKRRSRTPIGGPCDVLRATGAQRRTQANPRPDLDVLRPRHPRRPSTPQLTYTTVRAPHTRQTRHRRAEPRSVTVASPAWPPRTARASDLAHAPTTPLPLPQCPPYSHAGATRQAAHRAAAPRRPEPQAAAASRTSRHAAVNASTTAGSNCVPAQRRSSASASSAERATA